MAKKNILRDFTSDEKRVYKFKFGKVMASSLAGFVIGAIVATIILVTGYIIFTAEFFCEPRGLVIDTILTLMTFSLSAILSSSSFLISLCNFPSKLEYLPKK